MREVEYVTEPEEYSVKDFYKLYGDRLPLLVMVTQGYLGEGIFETFDRGQVFRVQTYTTQKRVVALVVSGEKGMSGLEGRQISIPVDYDVKFNILRHGKFKVAKPETLKHIIEHRQLPLEVQFDDRDEKAVKIGQSKWSTTFTLKLLSVYDDFLLLGNAINDGNLYGYVSAIPAYLPDLKFSIVKHIKGITDERYNSFVANLDKLVKENIRFNEDSYGNTEMALYSSDDDPDSESYSYISPCEYYNIGELLRHTTPKPSTRKLQKDDDQTIYEIVHPGHVDQHAQNPTYDSIQEHISGNNNGGASKYDEVDLDRKQEVPETGSKEGQQAKQPKPPPVGPKPDKIRRSGENKEPPPEVPKRFSSARVSTIEEVTSEKVEEKTEQVEVKSEQTVPEIKVEGKTVPDASSQSSASDEMAYKMDVEFESYPEQYSAREFYERHKETLPQLVMVVQGYLGEVGFETFDMGQVFRIQTYSSQKRVVAEVVSGEKGMYGLQGRQISIPVDYDVKFNIMKHGKPKGKSSTLKEIIAHKEFPIEVQCSGSEEETKFGPLERTSLFTLKLLNVYDDVYLLGNAINYGNLYESVTAVPVYLPDLRFSIIKGIKGSSEEEYKHFSLIADQFVKQHIKFDPTFGNTDIALFSRNQAAANDSYSYISPCEYYNMSELLRNPKPKPAAKPGKKNTEKVYEVFRASTISLGRDQSYSQLVINQTQKKSIILVDNQTLRESRSNLKSMNISKNVYDKQPKTPENMGPARSGLNVPAEKEKQQTTRTSSEQDNSKGNVNIQKPQAEPPKVPKRQSLSVEPPSYSSQTVGLATPVCPIKPQPTHATSATSALVSRTDVADVKSLTIEDIAEYLEMLNLGKYKDDFLTNTVDGEILSSMDESMLREDFQMTRFEAMKLMKFAKSGHVPKRRSNEN